MTSELFARFEKRFPRGAVVNAELRQPIGGFSITVLFGPSGCGKTTWLRCLAGLDHPNTGTISFNDQVWFDAQSRVNLTPQQRDIGFLFQEYALFPHLTVFDNIGYGLRGLGAPERKNRVGEIIELFQLDRLHGRYPHQLSGGQQQRVALARSLVRRPRLLLLDEPLSALDALLRDQLRSRLRRMLSSFNIPVIVVTHDRIEAIALADQVIVMDAGRVRQSGTVREVFSHPKDSQVARIVGVETIESGEIIESSNGLATIQVQDVRLVAVAPLETIQRVHVCIRSEEVILQRVVSGESAIRNQLPAVLTGITPEGPLVRVSLDCGFELTALVTRPTCEELRLEIGERMTALLEATSIHLIPRPGSPGLTELSGIYDSPHSEERVCRNQGTITMAKRT